VKATLKRARRTAGAIRRRLRRPPELAALRHAQSLADTTPRFTPGHIRMMNYELRYSDLLTFCPQWDDIFVKRSLEFRATTETPRILDCGANVGLATLYFKRACPRARITAFEADPSIAKMLRGNLDANAAADVDVVAAAVWTASGSVRFAADGADAGAISGGGSRPDRVLIDVPAVRLKDYLTADTVHLLKLDIEGAEAAVLADCTDALQRVEAALIEVHEFDRRRRATPEVLRLLADAGFAYAVTHVTPIADDPSWNTGPFPARSMKWVAAVAAWRNGVR
jgi:FkbM family methyltransferase